MDWKLQTDKTKIRENKSSRKIQREPVRDIKREMLNKWLAKINPRENFSPKGIYRQGSQLTTILVIIFWHFLKI